MSSFLHIGSADAEWTMIEEAVFRVFAELADKSTGEHVAIGPRLVELGWSDIEAEYPLHACELLFRAQGRSLADTDCLQRVMLAELTSVVGNDVDGVILPCPAEASEVWRNDVQAQFAQRFADAAAAGEVRTDVHPNTLAHWVTRICFSLIAEPGKPEHGGDEGLIRAFLPAALTSPQT